MRTFIADIIPKIQKFSQKLDDLTKLTNQHWVSLGEISETKRVFIFRSNNQLLISENGIVEKGYWEYLGNQSLLIETKENNYLFKHGFFDENVIALKLDSTNNYAFFVNETKYTRELNNIEDILTFLSVKYLKKEKSLDDSENINEETTEKIDYKIVSERNKFDLITGSIKVYKIQYSNGLIGNVYYSYTLKTYYYYEETGRVHTNTLEKSITKLFIRHKNNR